MSIGGEDRVALVADVDDVDTKLFAADEDWRYVAAGEGMKTRV